MATQPSLFTDGQNYERSQTKSQSELKDQVLDVLIRRGRVPCREIEDTFRSSQALVRGLQLDGHTVETVAGATPYYVYRGPSRRIKVTDELRNSSVSYTHLTLPTKA